MCTCSISTHSLIRSLAIMFLISVVLSDADLISANPPRIASTIVSDKDSILVPVPQTPPSKPRAPDCFYYFPGTPGWNECFRTFTQDMATYQQKMNEYLRTQALVEGGSTGDSTVTRYAPGQFYSGSSFVNSNSMSTSNSYTGGYAIHAVNMGLSTSTMNNIVKIIMHSGPIDKFDTKTSGNEITINILSKGQKKWAKIIVPKGIKLSDVRVDRSSDTVYINGPTMVNDGGNFQMSQMDSGSSYSSSNINQNFGQMQGAPMPPIPVSDFHNMFQNMFQNFFTNMFGERSPHGRQYNSPSSNYYSAPQMWFY